MIIGSLCASFLGTSPWGLWFSAKGRWNVYFSTLPLPSPNYLATWPVWKPLDKVSSRFLVASRFLNFGLEFDTRQPSFFQKNYNFKHDHHRFGYTIQRGRIYYSERKAMRPSMGIRSADWMLTSQYWSAHVTSIGSQGVWPRYLNIWISDLDNGIQSIFIQFIDVSQQGRASKHIFLRGLQFS